MSNFAIEGILDRLTQLDDDLIAQYGYSGRFEIVVVGGSALILTSAAPESRFTTDIDVLVASTEVENYLARYDMNTDVSTFLYQYPDNWNLRKRKVDFDGQVLSVYALSNEDIAITKLLAWRDADKADLREMKRSGNVDAEKLKTILHDLMEVQINLSEEEWLALQERAHELMGW